MKGQKPSVERLIDVQSEIPIQSLEDEVQLTSLENLSLGDKKKIRSLKWLLELPKEECERIFKQLPAQTLAQAWIGPDDLLKALSQFIPEKKLKMVQSYRARLQPHRHSSGFEYIFSETMRFLEMQANNDTDAVNERLSA